MMRRLTAPRRRPPRTFDLALVDFDPSILTSPSPLFQPYSKAGSKRIREVTDEELEAEAEPKLTKSERKQLAKKLRGEDGAAVPAPKVAAAKAAVPEPKAAEPKAEKKAATVKKITTPSGLIIEDSKVGTGPAAKQGKRVGMRYIGKLQNGKVFDSNTKGKPFSFMLVRGEVIKGWDVGVAGMSVGGERKLVIRKHPFTSQFLD